MPISPKADISPTRQVGVSATYMASDYDTDTAEASSGSQIYRVDLEVFEDSGAPAASLEMSLMAALVGDDTDGLDVTVNGVAVTLPTYSDSPAKNVTTDAHGRMTVEVDGSSSGALPQLVLIDDESVLAYQTVISPDWQNISRLSTLQAGDLDGTAATAYDGTALIAPAYQDGPDGPNLTAIATGVRNTIGGTSPPAGGEDALGPTRMVRMSPDLVSDTSGGRPWQAGEIPSFTLTLDDSAISFTYPLESHSLDPQDGLFHDIKDFTEYVYKEGKKVLEIAWDAAEDAATATVRALIEGVEDAITFVVETVEDAATVVVGFLASVAQDVERVLEWLSYVFEWQDIVNTATLIADSVTTAYQTFSTNLSGAVDDVVQHLDGAADQLKEDIGTALQPGGVVDQFLQSSLTGLQQTKQPPADVAGPLASSKSQTGWVAGRMTSGASAATLALPVTPTPACRRSHRT